MLPEATFLKLKTDFPVGIHHVLVTDIAYNAMVAADPLRRGSQLPVTGITPGQRAI